MLRILLRASVVIIALSPLNIIANAEPVSVGQGHSWTGNSKHQFYVGDQGSRIMPLKWMRALQMPGGESFLHDGLERYGYLPYANNGNSDVPLGFSVATYKGWESIGMTCSACHTRELYVKDQAYRIDGGPSFADIFSFFTDLNTASAAVLESDAAFKGFADRVYGGDANQTELTELRTAFEFWQIRYKTLMDISLKDVTPWGPGRLDAVTMIFNRITGLNLGETSPYIIKENIAVADVPTRYPFLWNAAKQDMTQWPGFLQNGNDVLGLVRNLGEVYGVFADMRPIKNGDTGLLDRDYITNNSANFKGLWELEKLIKEMEPPEWQWEVNEPLVKRGEEIFNRNSNPDDCSTCHGIERGKFRSLLHHTWKTTVEDVGTDDRECDILRRPVPKTGVMAGAKLAFVTGGHLAAENENAIKILATPIIGAIIQNELPESKALARLEKDILDLLPGKFRHLETAFFDKVTDHEFPLARVPKTGCVYEARVLQGIWAAAPYLHNGTVPTLEQLLTPPEDRIAEFPVGPDYDIDAVGLAATQTRTNYILKTTGCDDKHSGNSRCGHEYGTDLPEDDKKALIEYLKTY